MPKALLTSYRNHANGANALSLNGYCELLSELLRSFRRSFLIVDALDEYIDEEDIGFSTSPRLLEELKKILISCQSNCRLFLTSRSDRLAMSQAMAATRIEIRADEDDIRSYLSCKVHDPNFSHANLVNEHPGLAQDIVEALTKKAEGQCV